MKTIYLGCGTLSETRISGAPPPHRLGCAGTRLAKAAHRLQKRTEAEPTGSGTACETVAIRL